MLFRPFYIIPFLMPLDFLFALNPFNLNAISYVKVDR